MAGPPLLLYTHRATGELFRRRWTLVVAEGSDRGRRAEIADSPGLIGAAPASTLVLTDDTVSRYHAEIDVFAEGLRVRDLDSTNGTFLEGEQRIREGFVENGASFRVGRTLVRVVAVDEPAASEVETDPHHVAPGGVELLGPLLAASPAMREVFRLVRKVAPASSAVLFEGPPGTGKAALARVTHELGPRRKSPFVTFAAKSVPAEQQAASLFGAAGSSGAPVLGLFERASGGTLFIEGVDAIAPALQLRLTRVIERGEILRSGEDRQRRVDVRVLSSTTRDLERVQDFAPELFNRLAVVRLRVPGLCERLEDLGPLASRFLEDRRPGLSVGPRTLALLQGQAWPESARSLEQVVVRLLRPQGAPEDAPLRAAFLADLCATQAGNVTEVARALGLDARRLFAELALHRIELD